MPCETCRYWVRDAGTPPPQTGRCHAHPPQVQGGPNQAAYPRTKASDGCAEFRALHPADRSR